MPFFYVNVSSSDGSIDSPDLDGVTLGDIGAARALAIHTLVATVRDAPRSAEPCTITVTVTNGLGGIVYRDYATTRWRTTNPDDAAVGRAIRAMRRAT